MSLYHVLTAPYFVPFMWACAVASYQQRIASSAAGLWSPSVWGL